MSSNTSWYQRIADTEEQLRGTEQFFSPLAWRSRLAGICELDLPERLSANAIPVRDIMDIFRIFGAIDLDLRDVPGIGHARILSLVNTRRFDTFLRETGSGKHFAAIAITETNAGSDLRSIATIAKRHENGYVISGEKCFVSRISEATHIIVFAHVIPEARLTAFLIPSGTDGIDHSLIEGLGLRGVSWSQVFLNEVYVPQHNRLGGEGQATSLFAAHFAYWRTAMAAAAVGCAQGAMNQAIMHLQNRSCFGGPIGRFMHLQQQFSTHAAQLHMAWLLVLETSNRIDKRLPAYLDSAMSKSESLEAAIRAVEWTVAIHGARGVSLDMDLEKRLRDLLALRIADGTPDVLRGQVARALLGEQLYTLSVGRNQDDISAQRKRRLW